MKRFITVLSVCLFAATSSLSADRLQLKSLPTGKKSRIKVTDRVWPDKPGDASVCLWKDDKLAAFSITIDDNWKPDHPFWIEMGKKYGWHWTWFIITSYIKTNPGFSGTWADWQKLKDLGHDVQSHTVMHLHKERPEWKGIEAEYADSQKEIEANIKSHKVVVLAYPGGKNSKLNDPDIAAKYYVASRGTQGLVNQRRNINYRGTCSIGGVKSFFKPETHWASFAGLCNPQNKKKFRGWYNILFHGAGKEQGKANIAKALDEVKANEADIWVGTFSEIARYGQECDTAKLQTLSATPSEITMSLSDDMEDASFQYPLTLKVRLNDDWQAVAATQNGKSIDAKVIEHDQHRFALVQAIPDQGTIKLTK